MSDVAIAELGDKIAELTLKQAKELSDYIKEKYGIEPASGGGGMMMAAAAPVCAGLLNCAGLMLIDANGAQQQA